MGLRDVLKREESTQNDRQFCISLTKQRLKTLEFSQNKVIKSSHKGGVTWLDLDHVEHRYLLSGAADASIAVYDTQQPTNNSDVEHHPLFTLTKQSPGAHKYSVSSVAWYPVDTGLFVSSGFDNKVKVWDTNALAVACSFGLTDRVHAVAMSPISTSHCLVAAAGNQPQVTLCDITTGGFTHTLTGHRSGVWALHWSLTSEYELMSGGNDGQLILWDVRRAGPLGTFSMHHTTTTTAGRSIIPGELVASHTATAHDRGITGVVPTKDGLFWLSAGTDDAVRLWNSSTYRNMLVHYPDTYNRATKSRQIAVSTDSSVLFHPSGSAIQLFDIQRGDQIDILKGGHFESINCCYWNDVQEELYSGANDNNIIVWAPHRSDYQEEAIGNDTDNWSD